MMIMRLKCPKCGSFRLNKSGLCKSPKRNYQRYFCRDCYIVTLKPIKAMVYGIDFSNIVSIETGENND
jgi:hypothetical protein